MQKSILITGRPGSGKTSKALEIASQFQNDEVVFIDYRGEESLQDRFLFSECTEKTKLVVFNDLLNIQQIEVIFTLIMPPITVRKMRQKPFTIEPKYILVCQGEIGHDKLIELGCKRFELIHCTKG